MTLIQLRQDKFKEHDLSSDTKVLFWSLCRATMLFGTVIYFLIYCESLLLTLSLNPHLNPSPIRNLNGTFGFKELSVFISDMPRPSTEQNSLSNLIYRLSYAWDSISKSRERKIADYRYFLCKQMHQMQIFELLTQILYGEV